MGTTPELRSELEREHAWLALGAVEKAKSVQMLTAKLSIRTLLEIGCGTGAVLESLDDAGFGEQYFALEPSLEMFTFMMDRKAISRLAAAEPAMLAASRFRNAHFDLAILSHVLEHLEDPAALLSEAIQTADYVLVEVPLDGNLLGNMRADLKSRLTRIARRNNAAGHVQFFSDSDIRSLVQWCGGEVLCDRLYVPRPQLKRLLAVGSLPRRIYAGSVLRLSCLVGECRWARLYHGHYAVLVRRRPPLSVQERTRHSTVYYQSDVAKSV